MERGDSDYAFWRFTLEKEDLKLNPVEMDPLSVNQRHFQRSNSNSACYNLSEIWNLPINGAIEKSGGGLNLRTPCFGSISSMIGDVSSADSASFEQLPVNGGCRKRGGGEDESSKGPSCSNGKRNKKAGSKEEGDETAKKDYIHVRARRGQATDSHSLAERARREKISERMKILQDIVPGCNKVIGKAVVLDEIINYIQSLQRQVEFLSMKIEALNSKTMSDNAMGEFPSKVVYAEQDYNATILAYRSQINREYDCGPPSHEWLTGGVERSNRVKLADFSSTTNKTMYKY